MNTEDCYKERWVDEKTAAKHLKVKPTTKRKKHGKRKTNVLYN